MTDEEAAAYVAAGRLLQSKEWPHGRKEIERGKGESYPQAVARVVSALPGNEKEHLRQLVAWVRSYERAESSM